MDINVAPLSNLAVVRHKPLRSYLASIRKIWAESFVMWANFGITFMLYPSILTQKNLTVAVKTPAWNFYLFTLAFSLGDVSGRFIGDKFYSKYSRFFLFTFLGARFSLIATTFVMGFDNDPNSFWNISSIILLNTFLVGFTNGYLVVAAGCSFPDRLQDNEKEFGGFIISVMINFGIAMGSLVSLLAFKNVFN